MSSTIQLNFINHSNDINNSSIVIFQQNTAPGYAELAVAWKVIQNCGQGYCHPFKFESQLYVSASDSYGNYTPQLSAVPGMAFVMTKTGSGDKLSASGNAASQLEIDVKNQLQMGAINANLYRSGRLLATKTNVVPGQMAAFVFRPVIFIGVVSDVQEGDVLDSAILSDINTEISLLGISSADIIMTGGGPGPNSQPYSFSLQNIVMA